MKKILHFKRVLRATLLVLLMSVVGIEKISGQTSFSVDNLNYSINENGTTVTLTGGSPGNDGVLNIPNQVTYGGRTYAVTKIGDRAFRFNYGVRFLNIGESVNIIGESAFDCCFSLEGTLTIPSSVSEIGDYAFYHCENIRGELIIPNAVTKIGDGAFAFCSGFTGVLTIPSSVTYIGGGAFQDCNGFTLIQYNADKAVTDESSGGAFKGCTGSLIIGENVKKIPKRMFAFAGFTGILTIPNTVTRIEDCAFMLCDGFEEIHFNANNACTGENDEPFDRCSGALVLGDNVNAIPNCMFRNAAISSLIIPSSVSSIGYSAFQGCSNLVEVYFNAIDCSYSDSYNRYPFVGCSGTLFIGDNVVRISDRMFVNAAFTGNLNIPNSITEIGNGAFSGCSGLSGSLIIPSSLISIGSSAFSGCSGIKELQYNAVNCVANYLNYTGYYPFYGCTGVNKVIIGENVESIPDNLFRGFFGYGELDYNAIHCSDISASPFDISNTRRLIIGDKVEYIPSGIFRKTNDVGGFGGTLTIPNSVTEIGDYAFSGCSGFNGSLVIPNSVTEIGDYAFSGCSGFNGSLVIPNSVTEIGDYAFSGCSGFNGSLIIPNSVTEIGEQAFYDCSGFTGDLILGNSMMSIGKSAFNGCGGFTGSLIIPNTVTEIGNLAFANCSGFTGTLTIPKSVETIGNRAFLRCEGISVVDYCADNCLSIEESFRMCSFVTVNIGENVQSIPANAFKGCSTINTIIAYGTTPPTLGSNAFSNISSVATLFVPCGSQMAYFSSWNIFNYNNIHEDCTPRPVLVDSNVTGGTITPSVSEASMGQEVTLTVSPNPLMEMVSVTAYNTNSPSQLIPISPVDGTAVPTYKFIMPMFGVTISATFEHSSVYLVNVSQDIVGGSVTASTSEALAGETVELEVNPDYGYNLLQLSVCNYNDPSQTVTVTNRTFVMPSFDVMVSATFKKTIFSISISPGITGGTVSTSVSEQRAGKPVTIEALPNYGYELRSLTVANVNDPAQTVDVITASSIGGVGFIMPSFDVMVSAEFVYTSVDESEINPISVYPNPTSGVVKIEAENLRHISVFNVLGQKVYEEQVDGDELEINLSGCEPGVYLIRIETASGVTTKQVVVTK